MNANRRCRYRFFPPNRYTQTEIANALVEPLARPPSRTPAAHPPARQLRRRLSLHRLSARPLSLPHRLQADQRRVDHRRRRPRRDRHRPRPHIPRPLPRPTSPPSSSRPSTGIASPTIDARLINRMPFPHPRQAHLPIFGPRLRRRSRRHRARQRLPPRLPRPVRAAPLRRALLPHLAGRRPVRRQHHLHRPLRRWAAPPSFSAGSDAVIPKPPPAAPRILATRSTFYRHTEHIMGWISATPASASSSRPTSPRVVLENVRRDVESFLADQVFDGKPLALADIASWIFHSGGPKVLEATEKALSLPADALAPQLEIPLGTRQSLRRLRPLRPGRYPRQPARRARYILHPRRHGPRLLPRTCLTQVVT